jgi:organic radical activating enzyme
MLRRSSVTFYITNVCNFGCDQCDHFNNYTLTGHQRWADNEESCRQWAGRIDPAIVGITGGEPLTNPDFLKWLHGLANLWPLAEIRFLTNGTAFDLWPNLYQELLPYQGRVNFSISNHNSNDKTREIDWIKGFLKGKISQSDGEKVFRKWIWAKAYHEIKDSSWPECSSLDEYYQLPQWIQDEIKNLHGIDVNNFVVYDEPSIEHDIFVDENGMRVAWVRTDWFENSSIKFNKENNLMEMFDSDPEKAVSVCHGGMCSYVKNGKWYKCSVVGNVPDLINQGFPIKISQEDESLLRSYTPADPSWSDQELQDFFYSIENKKSIAQCKLCPETKTRTLLTATKEKPKVSKIKFIKR